MPRRAKFFLDWFRPTRLTNLRTKMTNRFTLAGLVGGHESSGVRDLEELANTGLDLLNRSRTKPHNDLVPDQERELGTDLILASIPEYASNRNGSRTFKRAFDSLLGRRELAAANLLIQEWSEADPDDILLAISRSSIALVRHEFELAVEEAYEAINLAPSSKDAHRQLARSLRSVSRWSDAEVALRDSLDFGSEDPSVSQELAQVEAELNFEVAFPRKSAVIREVEVLPPDFRVSDLELLLQEDGEMEDFLISSLGIADLVISKLLSKPLLPSGSAFVFARRPGGSPSAAESGWIFFGRAVAEFLVRCSPARETRVRDDLIRNYRGAGVTCRISESYEANRLDASTPTYPLELITARAESLLGSSSVRSLRRQLKKTNKPVMILVPEDWEQIGPKVELLDVNLIVLVPSGYCRLFVSEGQDRIYDSHKWLEFASSVVLVDTEDEEWFEDNLGVALPVHKNYIDGVDSSLRVAESSICVAVGAGIGNLLFSTPLIKALHELTGCPVDVVLNSPIQQAVQLFGESTSVNMVTTSATPRKVQFNKVFVTSSFGKTPFGLRSNELVSQRAMFDFYSETQSRNEAVFAFFGAERLFPNLTPADSLHNSMFVRNFSPSSQDGPNPGRIVGVSSSQKGGLWANRAWHGFPGLVAELRALGLDVRSFGLPEDVVPGSKDETSRSLRSSVRRMSACQSFICTDGGVFHIFDALGVPGLAIFGPTADIKNGPLNPRVSKFRSSISCSPCQFHEGFTRCTFAACMAEISVCEIRDVFVSLRAEGFLPVETVERLSTRRSSFRLASHDFWRLFEQIEINLPETVRLVETSLKYDRVHRARLICDAGLARWPASRELLVLRAQVAVDEGDWGLAFQMKGEFGVKECAEADWSRVAEAADALRTNEQGQIPILRPGVATQPAD